MDFSRISRKLLAVLFFAQSAGSASLITVSTVSPIIAARLSGTAAMAGVPASIFLFGSAFAALVWGQTMDRLGRRGALTLGLAIGSAGAFTAGISLVAGIFMAYLGGMLMMGIAQSALQLSRFAAAEVHPPQQRARAISTVVLAGVVGAVFGPLLVAPTGNLAVSAGYDELAGPFLAALLLFILAGLIVFLGLRPDPRDLAFEIARAHPEKVSHNEPARPVLQIFRQPAPFVALSSMAFGQMVMVLLMVITALHMRDHDHALSSVSLVISSHAFGMFAFSIVSGRLADRFGREPVILIGAGTLILASFAAVLSPQVLPLAVALFLLGLGWNFCYVGGSSLLADHLAPQERARTQGVNDLIIGFISAAGSLSSGVIYSSLGYNMVALFGALVSLVLFGLVMWWQLKRIRLAAAQD